MSDAYIADEHSSNLLRLVGTLLQFLLECAATDSNTLVFFFGANEVDILDKSVQLNMLSPKVSFGIQPDLE